MLLYLVLSEKRWRKDEGVRSVLYDLEKEASMLTPVTENLPDKALSPH